MTGAELSEAEAAEESETKQAEYSPERAELFRSLMSHEYDLTLANTASKITVSEIAEKHLIPPKAIFTKDKSRPQGISAAAQELPFMRSCSMQTLKSCTPRKLLPTMPLPRKPNGSARWDC